MSFQKSFDATKRYPGEGPAVSGSRRSRSAPPRPTRDLGETLHAPSTTAERVRSISYLQKWLADQGHPDLHLLLTDIRNSNVVLADFVQHCYDSVLSQGFCINALLGIHDRSWEVSRALPLPWKRMTSWQRGEPPELRNALPVFVFRSVLCLSLLWGWHSFADSMLIMFHGVGRPDEVFDAFWDDVYFPR